MQFHRTDLGEGMLLAFRMPDSPFVKAVFRLRGLAPRAEYEIEDSDTGMTFRRSGWSMMERGHEIEMEHAPESCRVFHRRES